MTKRQKRSLLFSFILGDGCFHYINQTYKGKTTVYGGLTIDHGVEQSDYQTWKAQIISNITGNKVKIRNGHQGKSIQISVCKKIFRVWRKFLYPKGKKDISLALKYIIHPEFALAVWLMDDGYCEPSTSKLADGTKKTYGARFRLFTCSETPESHKRIIEWFQKEFQMTPKIYFANKQNLKKSYPYIKFNQQDSLKIWSTIRETVLGIKSMRHKFRYIEELYQNKVLQPVPSFIAR